MLPVNVPVNRDYDEWSILDLIGAAQMMNEVTEALIKVAKSSSSVIIFL